MRISQEEIFGPVVSVIKFKDEADALRIANGTAYSLAAGVWSRDMGRVQRFAKRARAGTVWINTYGYTDVRLPWGGERDSGLGREHGNAAIENFTEPKAVWIISTSDRAFCGLAQITADVDQRSASQHPTLRSYAARAGGPAASSSATSSSVKTRLRVRKRTPSGASTENPEPRPGTTSMMSCVCRQYSNWAAPI